jgi:hypothetical protein
MGTWSNSEAEELLFSPNMYFIVLSALHGVVILAFLVLFIFPDIHQIRSVAKPPDSATSRLLESDGELNDENGAEHKAEEADHARVDDGERVNDKASAPLPPMPPSFVHDIKLIAWPCAHLAFACLTQFGIPGLLPYLARGQGPAVLFWLTTTGYIGSVLGRCAGKRPFFADIFIFFSRVVASSRSRYRP